MTTTEIQVTQIGTIDGETVTAEQIADGLIVYTMRYQGLELFTDGREFVQVQPMSGGCEGDMTIEEWAAIKRLAQTDVMEQLIALALAQ